MIVEALDPPLADVRQGGVFKRQRCAHPGLLRQIVEAGFGVAARVNGVVAFLMQPTAAYLRSSDVR